MESMPHGGDVLEESSHGSGSPIRWMQWIDRESFLFILLGHDVQIMSGPHSAEEFNISPMDPLVMLLYEASYSRCVENKSNET